MEDWQTAQDILTLMKMLKYGDQLIREKQDAVSTTLVESSVIEWIDAHAHQCCLHAVTLLCHSEALFFAHPGSLRTFSY